MTMPDQPDATPSETDKALQAIDMDKTKDLKNAVHDELIKITERLTEEYNTYGLSVLTLAMQIIVMELRKTDEKALGQYLRALADLFSPPEAKLRMKGRHKFLTEAERRRRDAIMMIFNKMVVHTESAQKK